MRSRPFPALAVGVSLLAVAVVFFPTLFFGRVISPVDTLLSEAPWQASQRAVEVTNPELRLAATTLLPRMLEAQRVGTATAVWSPFLACGGPGNLSLSSGLLSPFVLPFLPWLDPAFLLNAMVLAKLLAAFAGAYLLARRVGQGEAAATLASAAFALSGPVAARWLEPVSATLALLPLLLWAVDVGLARRAPFRALPATAGVWLATLAGGEPGACTVAVLTAGAWAAARVVTSPASRRQWAQGLLASTLALLLALLILAPALGLHLAAGAPATPERAAASGWGAWVARLLVDPMAWGDPRADTYEPPHGFGPVPYAASCLTVGLVTLVLALVGAVSRWRGRAFWVALAALCLIAMAWTPLTLLATRLPGVTTASLLAPVAALALALLAGAGGERLQAFAPTGAARPFAFALAVAVVLEQGLLAGHLLAYLPPKAARLRPTPALEQLRTRLAERPDRVAPLDDTLWPNTAAALQIDDVRVQGQVAPEYRRWMQAVDPQVFGHFGDVLRLNAASLDLGHPYLHALGARYLLEPPARRLVEYALGQRTLEVEPSDELLGPLGNGEAVVQELELPAGCSRIGVPATSQHQEVAGDLEASLVDEVTATEVGRWSVPVSTLADEGIAWLDLQAAPETGRRHRLILRPRMSAGRLWLRCAAGTTTLSGRLLLAGRERPLDLALAFDVSGYAVIAAGPDLRVWESRRAAPRFWVVHRAVAARLEELLAANPPLALDRVAVLDPQQALTLALVEPNAALPERLVLRAWTASSYRLETDLAAPALLVSSVRAQLALWRATVDGEPCAPITANGLFLGLPLPAGRHRVELRARLPAVWYGYSLAGATALLGLAIAAGYRRNRPAKGRATP